MNYKNRRALYITTIGANIVTAVIVGAMIILMNRAEGAPLWYDSIGMSMLVFSLQTVLAAFLFSIIVMISLQVAFAFSDAKMHRVARKNSQRYASAYAMVYVLERLHGKRLDTTRERLTDLMKKNGRNYRGLI